MDIKIAVLVVFISVIYVTNAKPTEEYGEFPFCHRMGKILVFILSNS